MRRFPRDQKLGDLCLYMIKIVFDYLQLQWWLFYVSIRKMNILVQYFKYLKMMTCPNKCLETGIFKLSIQNGGFWFVCENRFYGVKNPAQVFSSISRIYSWYVTNAINDPCQHLLWFINSRIVIFRVFALSMITNKLLEQFRLNR